jgi:hypothetical protein
MDTVEVLKLAKAFLQECWYSQSAVSKFVLSFLIDCRRVDKSLRVLVIVK